MVPIKNDLHKSILIKFVSKSGKENLKFLKTLCSKRKKKKKKISNFSFFFQDGSVDFFFYGEREIN